MRAALLNLLSRLEDVRDVGHGRYRARCPSHDSSDRALAIRETDDGHILFKCHAECDSEAVLRAVGLQFRDLYPDHDRDPARAPRSGGRTRIDWRRVCRGLLLELSVVEIAAAQGRRGEPFTVEDWQHILDAFDRITALRGALHATERL